MRRHHSEIMWRFGGGSFIFEAIGAVSILIISIGVFYVLVKLGSFLDAMKEKT